MKGLIFDLDDTLYKESTYRDSGYRTIARHYAAACGLTPDELYQRMKVNPAMAFETVGELAAERGLTVSVDDQLTIYRSHRPDITLPDETVEVLNELKKRGYAMGVITDGRAFGQLNKIAALGLDRFFDPSLIMATVMFGTDKHSAKPFEIMAGKIPAAESFAYIGDNPEKDFHHPNLMGWDTIMLRDKDGVNIHLDDYPAEFRPKRIIGSLRELLTVF